MSTNFVLTLRDPLDLSADEHEREAARLAPFAREHHRRGILADDDGPVRRMEWHREQAIKKRLEGRRVALKLAPGEPTLYLRDDSDELVRKRWIPGATAIRVKDANAEHHRFEGIASSSRPDLDGDVIEQGGWVLPSYLPILASHERGTWPVARTEHIRVAGDKLVVIGVFPPTGSSSKSDEARALVAAGVLRGISVGFKPLARPTPNAHGGLTFTRQQLNEISLVAVPAQPEALVTRTW